MDNKKDIKGVLLAVFIIISILLAGFIVYDKFLKEDDGSCVTVPCNCEEKKELVLASKYVNEQDKDSYLTFDTTKKTWKGIRNNCEGYEEVEGTYVIENNVITLNSEVFDSYNDIVKFEMIADGSNIKKLHDMAEDKSGVDVNFYYTGCSPTAYFIAE